MRKTAIAIAGAVGLIGGMASLSNADAAIFEIDLDTATDSRTLGDVGLGDGVAVNALIEDESFSNTVAFLLTDTANISVSSTWFAKSIFANSFNLELFGPDGFIANDGNPEFNTNTDTVSSILSAGGLAPGVYALVATGTVFGQAANYDYKVEVTPIPTAIALLGTGLAGLAVVGFRRRKAS